MKLTAEAIQDFFNSVDNASDIIRSNDGSLLSFSYMKYYGESKHTGKKIKVSLKSTNELRKAAAVELSEAEFFNLLADNVNDVTGIKLHCDKIYKFELAGRKYITEKSGQQKLFDFLPYKDFLKVTKQRFYGNDKMLRNGYFSGLIGTNDDNILYYEENREKYDLYDVDFNAAYPYCFKLPLPTGKFYTAEEWNKSENAESTYIKFYQIKIKCIMNPFKVFLPPPPYIEYSDFDFLLQKNSAHMVVSEHRLKLIDKVYGRDTYIIKQTYYCKTKKYLKLADFSEKLYKDIQAAKKSGDSKKITELKIALNSLVGNFGKRDEAKNISGLRLYDSELYKDIISVEWGKIEEKEQKNYLPISMAINDITALRLFNIMTDENALRLCYNTDGGIIALKKGCRIVTSENIGRLKAKPIYFASFLYTTQLYNRPLILDCENGQVYNSKAIEYSSEQDCFLYSENIRLNTRQGFITHSHTFPIPVEKWQPFNFRASEVFLRLSGNDLFKRLKKTENDIFITTMLEDAAEALNKMCNPYNADFNDIRHAPPREYICIQENFIEKFFKVDKNIKK